MLFFFFFLQDLSYSVCTFKFEEYWTKHLVRFLVSMMGALEASESSQHGQLDRWW